ncbi:flagellar hook-associated protein FlgK [Bacillus cereus]
MGFNYDVSLSGLLVGSNMLSATQNNIANIETPGYARQRVEVKASSSPVSGSGMQIGSGVWMEGVSRIRDELIIQQARHKEGYVGYYEELTKDLKTIETMFNEGKEGSVSGLLGSYFQSWEELSKFPEQNSYRAQVVGISQSLAGRMNTIIKQLDVSKSETDQKIRVNVDKVNDLVGRIAKINGEIGKVGPNQNPNALFDERDRYIDELSKYVDVNVKKNPNNSAYVDVEIGNVTAVSGADALKVEGYYKLSEDRWTLGVGNVEVDLKSGILKSNLEMRNEKLDGLEKKLNDFAKTFINEVNSIHRSGYGLDGSTGLDFFVGTDARSIAVNSVLKDDYEKIASSGVSGVIGDVSIAKSMAELQNKAIYAGGTMTAERFYQGMSVELGTNVNQLQDRYKVHAGIRVGIEEERQKIQGVSMDEEMMNLMQFQKFYQMNAKALQTIDSSFETLIGIIR